MNRDVGRFHAYALARIRQCRRDEDRLGDTSGAIEAATERRAWQTALGLLCLSDGPRERFLPHAPMPPGMRRRSPRQYRRRGAP